WAQSLVVAMHPGALNMAQPEYTWAQSLVVAMHSVKLAYGDNVTYSEVSLEAAAEELDLFRRQYNLAATTPSSKYYLANCRVLHSRERGDWNDHGCGVAAVRDR
ncbi:MAG: hypothetical protein ACKPKO_63455, partial [Candidatus Fonsibacter sp.]